MFTLMFQVWQRTYKIATEESGFTVHLCFLLGTCFTQRCFNFFPLSDPSGQVPDGSESLILAHTPTQIQYVFVCVFFLLCVVCAVTCCSTSCTLGWWRTLLLRASSWSLWSRTLLPTALVTSPHPSWGTFWPITMAMGWWTAWKDA